MNCVILSAQKETRKAVEEVISQNKILQIIDSFANIKEARDTLHKHKTDIVFIDIETPGMDGYGMLDDLPHGRPFKVFLSTQKELAKDAFDYDAADFILLPMTPLALMRAITKITRSKKNVLAYTANPDYIFLKTNRAIHKVEVKDILYVEALADYVTIHTASERYVVHSTMKSMLGKLSHDDFVRVHKSYIVNISHVSKIEAKTVLLDKKSLPLSRPYKLLLLKKIGFSK